MIRKKKKISVYERRVVRNYVDSLLGNLPRSNVKMLHNDMISINRVMGREHVRELFRKALKIEGLDESQLAQNFVKLTKAKKTHLATFRGTVGDKTVLTDNPIRLEANKVVAKLIGLEPSKELDMKHSGYVGSTSALEMLSDDELEDLKERCEEEEVLETEGKE